MLLFFPPQTMPHGGREMATHPHHQQSLGCCAPELSTLKIPVMAHQEDHSAFRSEGLGDPEKS